MIVDVSLRPAQMEVLTSNKRFRVLVAGRRFGKTHLALVELLRAACGPDRKVWYIAPSYKQAKRIAWDRLKKLTQPFWASAPSETELSIRLQGGGVIALKGADQYDSLRGDGLDFVVLDEYASMHPMCWTEVIRPALADRQGGALFIGTPQGFNHFYERFEHAHKDPEWAAFQFSTEEGGNVSASELASASRELDERCFRQEFQARFESIGKGQAYYAFQRTGNVRPSRYQPGRALIWSMDFNVDPMSSVLAQREGDTVYVLDEIILPDANTPAACEAFYERTRPMREMGPVTLQVYGDASGNQRNTAGARTDWSIIRDFFGSKRGEFEVTFRIASANPAVKDRINCVNSRLRNAADERQLLIDPRCRELIRDFEQVCWKSDANGNATGELDKSDPKRTHVSDALGYYLSQAFPMQPKAGERQERLW